MMVLSLIAASWSGLHCVLSAAKATGKKHNQKDKQDESESTSAHQRSTEVKAATAEQEHQYD
jgi:hypothetical protein